jgi:hypothetical protein
MDGVGQHEVIVETPQHNLIIPLMEDKQAEEIILAYRERYLALRQDPRYKVIIIFKKQQENGKHGVSLPLSRWCFLFPVLGKDFSRACFFTLIECQKSYQ